MKKNITYQSVAIILAVIFSVIFTAQIHSEDIKPAIQNALDNGDTSLAIELINNDIAIDANYHFNYYLLGEIYFEQMKYQKAAEQYQIALEKKKKHYDSLYKLGLCYLYLEKLDEAEKVMDEGRKKDKDNKDRFEDGYGQVMLAKKDFQEADRSFRSALVDKPNNADYHIHLGDANFYSGIPSLAIVEYEKALEVDTASLEVYYHWAEACLEMKDFNCAIEKLRVVLTKDSTYGPAWMRAAGIYFKAARSSRSREERKTRFMEAIGAYKKYLDLTGAQPDSSNVRVYFELAMAYEEINGFEDAVIYFDKVLSIPYEPKDIYFYYGKSLWGVKDYVKSGEMLQKQIEWVAKQDPESYRSSINDFELYQLLGDSYYYRKDKDFFTAIDYYKQSLAERPDQKRLLYNVAVGYNILKSYEQALEYYDKRIALGIDEKSIVNYMRAGYCALNIARRSQGDEEENLDEEMMDEGMGEYTGATMEDTAPAKDIDYYQLAVNYFLKYLEYKPDDYKILSEVAYTYLYSKSDCTNGVKYYEQLAALAPDSCMPKRSLGYAYFGGVCQKQYTKALGYLLDAYNCATKTDGACSDVNLTLWVAQCYHLRAAAKAEKAQNANDDFKEAFNWYGKVLKCEPSNSVAKKGQDDVRFEFN